MQIRKVALALAAAGMCASGASAQIVVAGSDAGTFANAIAANNSSRVATEFWDNLSADIAVGNLGCNIGFFAAGTLSPGCVNQTPGSNGNQGGYNIYWGDGAGNRDASSFLFNGLYSYHVTLVGAYSGNSSTVGWFTVDQFGTRSFHTVGGWGSKVLGTTIAINSGITGGLNWGFFIRNTFNPQSGGCLGTDTDCSDATGGFTGAPFQQFALFNASGTDRFLAGAEDNALELLVNNALNRDSDYNDYILSVHFAPEPVTMALLATGLVALAGVSLLRRWRKPPG